MLNTRLLSDEELRNLASRPRSVKEAEALIKINQSARQLLSLNIREMSEDGDIIEHKISVPRTRPIS